MLWIEFAIHWIEPYIYLLFLNLGCIIFGMKHTVCSVNEIHGKQRFGTRQTVCCVWHTVNNSWHPTGRQTLLPCILFNGSSKKKSSQLTVGRYVFRTFALCFTDQRAYYQNNISLLPHGKDYVSGSVSLFLFLYLDWTATVHLRSLQEENAMPTATVGLGMLSA
jgi:hypothetical protein